MRTLAVLLFVSGVEVSFPCNAQVPICQHGKCGTLFTSLTAFGDSITTGFNASTPEKQFVNLLGTSLGITPRNWSNGGAQVIDQAISVFSVNTDESPRPLYLHMFGTIDRDLYTENPILEDVFDLAEGAELLWLALPVANKIPGNEAPATTGTWVRGQHYPIEAVSSEVGSTMTFTVRGTVAYLVYGIQDNNGGAFALTVDGRLVGNYASAPRASIQTNNGGSPRGVHQNDGSGLNWGPQLIRIPGLALGTHVLTVTVTSASTSANSTASVIFAGGNSVFHETLPTVLAGGAPLQNWGAWKEQLLDGYRQLVMKNAKTLAADGLAIVYVPVNTFQTPQGLWTDNVHPIDLGEKQIHDAFWSAIAREYLIRR